MQCQKIGIITVNLNRVGKSLVGEAVCDINRIHPGALICLQEVPFWGNRGDLQIEGFVAIRNPTGHSAVLIPGALSNGLRHHSFEGRQTAVQIGTLGLVSVYLADAWKDDHMFHQDVDDLRKCIKELRRAGARTINLAGDFQIELPPSLEGFTGPRARGRENITKERTEDRLEDILDLMAEFNLRAFNTFCSGRWNEECFLTRAPLGKQREDGSQLDYIMGTAGQEALSDVDPRKIMRTDHFGVWATLCNVPRWQAKKKFQHSFKGWKPADEAEDQRYKEGVVRSIGLDRLEAQALSRVPKLSTADLCSQVAEITPTLRTLAEELPKAAMCISHTCSKKPNGILKPQELQLTMEQSRSCKDMEQKRLLRRKERKLRRKWKAEQARQKMTNGRKRKKIPTALEFKGKNETDREKWAEGLEDHCVKKYSKEVQIDGAPSKLELFWEGTALAYERDGLWAPTWTLAITMDALAKMKPNTAAGPETRLLVNCCMPPQPLWS